MSHHDRFPAGTLVSVRADPALPWRDGVSQGLTPGGQCYRVTLDTPITADEWSGKTRKYGGSNPVQNIQVYTQVDFVDPDQLIKAR
jgi:hypothetical protein